MSLHGAPRDRGDDVSRAFYAAATSQQAADPEAELGALLEARQVVEELLRGGAGERAARQQAHAWLLRTAPRGGRS